MVGSGPLGLLIAYLILERRADRADRKESEAARLSFDERRLAADLRTAGALTALALKITGKQANDDGG